MPKYSDDSEEVNIPPLLGRCVWKDDAKKLEFFSSYPREEAALKTAPTTNNFKELQLRAEWLAEILTTNRRGRQSVRSSRSAAHFSAYRCSVLKRPGDRVTIDDVKQVAVGLLQENYLLPIPRRFLDLLTSEELDEVLATLLLYLSCFFDHRSLENKPVPLAVSRMSPNRTEWLLHACIYSFFCCVAWVTFGRKDLKDIQEEVGRLLYSDSFNTAVKSRTDRSSEMTSAIDDASVKTGAADCNMMTCNSAVKPRTSQRRLPLSSVVHQRSPLMVSLLPSHHLFPGSRARSPIPLRAERCDTKALMKQLDQQVAGVSFGILGKPLAQFSRSTLLPSGDAGEAQEAGRDLKNRSSRTPLSKYGSTTLIKSRNGDLAHGRTCVHMCESDFCSRGCFQWPDRGVQ